MSQMFRTKGLSILQNIANKSLYDVAHANLLPYTLFSTDASHGDSNKASSHAFNDNYKQSKTKILELLQDSTETSENVDNAATTLLTTSNEDEVDKLYKKVEIEVRGNDPAVLNSYGKFAVMAAEHLDITVGRNIAPQKAIHERLTVLKSIHIHKKHRVQYETRTYYRYLDFFRLTSSTADTFLEYIQRNLPEGVAMKVTKVELQTMPPTVQQAAPP